MIENKGIYQKEEENLNCKYNLPVFDFLQVFMAISIFTSISLYVSSLFALTADIRRGIDKCHALSRNNP